MRESFGGAFIIKLVLVFIVIYISFMAIAVEYGKTFRVKNYIINKLEQSQYSGTASENAVLEEIAIKLGNIGYNRDEIGNSKCRGTNNTSSSTELFIKSTDIVSTTSKLGGGYCLQKIDDGYGHYYKVTTYITGELKFFNIPVSIPVSGETKIIYQ